MFKPKSILSRDAARRVRAVYETLPQGDTRTAYRNFDNACYFNRSVVEEVSDLVGYAVVTGLDSRPAMVY